MKLDTILVPLDGSALAEAALPKATELAERTGARLILLRAAEAHSLLGADPTEAQIQVVEEAETYLAGVADRLRAAGYKRLDTVVWYGPAAAAIVEAARLHKVDLITMTTHGRSGLGRLIMGSVAESVLRVRRRRSSSSGRRRRPWSSPPARQPPKPEGSGGSLRNESRRASRPAPQDLRTGSPATEIVAGATSWGADLIAMATHGCGGLGRFLFGSIAEAVLRTAPQPVLMIRTAAKAAARAGEARP